MTFAILYPNGRVDGGHDTYDKAVAKFRREHGQAPISDARVTALVFEESPPYVGATDQWQRSIAHVTPPPADTVGMGPPRETPQVEPAPVVQVEQKATTQVDPRPKPETAHLPRYTAARLSLPAKTARPGRSGPKAT